jgi:uncharacterized membrane protein YebE (DUF533 family)
MVSIGWVVAAFLLGATAGLLVLALVAMAAREDGHAEAAEQLLVRESLTGTGAGPSPGG